MSEPGQIIDGDAEELGSAQVIADLLALQGLTTLFLLDHRIIRAATMGADAIFAVEFDDGSRMQFKVLSFDRVGNNPPNSLPRGSD